MGHREQILSYLKAHPEGVDDDDLAAALHIPQRQTVNAYCRRMAEEGLVQRREVLGKIHNFLAGSAQPTKPKPLAEPSPSKPKPSADPSTGKPWHWEGHVQGAVVAYLSAQGYTILRAADTSTRETGKDIIARKGSGLLWVTVKGYPEPTPNTPATTQAGHWFKDALFDIVAWRGEDPGAELALALPDYDRYRNLAQRVAWLQSATPFLFFWVSEDGSVAVERPAS